MRVATTPEGIAALATSRHDDDLWGEEPRVILLSDAAEPTSLRVPPSTLLAVSRDVVYVAKDDRLSRLNLGKEQGVGGAAGVRVLTHLRRLFASLHR